MDENKYIGEISSNISVYSLPSAEARPYGFFYDHSASSFGFNDYWTSTIGAWDVEDKDSYYSKELFIFDFKIRTLVTAFQHKHSNLFLYESNRDLRDLVRDIDASKVQTLKRHEFPSELVNDLKGTDTPKIRINGIGGFREENIVC